MKIFIFFTCTLFSLSTSLAQPSAGFNSRDEHRGDWTSNSAWIGGTAPDNNLNGTG